MNTSIIRSFSLLLGARLLSMSKLQVSVVVPTLNEEDRIEKFLKQFDSQTLPRDQFEIIIVDGNSRDKTREIAKKYADKVIIQKGKGIGGARNDGVKIAKSDIIATTDADIIVSQTWLKQIVNHFKKDEELILLYGVNYPMSKNKAIIFIYLVKRWLNSIGYKLHLVYFATATNSAFRKKPYIAIGGYLDMPIYDDIEITTRIRRLGKIRYDPTIFVYSSVRRIHKYGIIRFVYWGLTGYLKILYKRRFKQIRKRHFFLSTD